MGSDSPHKKRKNEGNDTKAKKQKTDKEDAKAKVRTPSQLLSSLTISKTAYTASETTKLDFKFYAFEQPRFEFKIITKAETQKLRLVVSVSGLEDIAIHSKNFINIAVTDKTKIQVQKQGTKPDEWIPSAKDSEKILGSKEGKVGLKLVFEKDDPFDGNLVSVLSLDGRPHSRPRRGTRPFSSAPSNRRSATALVMYSREEAVLGPHGKLWEGRSSSEETPATLAENAEHGGLHWLAVSITASQ